TQHPASCVCDGSHAWNTASNHHTDDTLSLAVQANAMGRNRGRAAVNESTDNFDELLLVDRATTQLEIDLHMCRYRRACFERRDVLGPGIHDGYEFLHIAKISKRLNASCGRAGADSHKNARLLSDLLNSFRIMRSGNRSLDQRKVVRAFDD